MLNFLLHSTNMLWTTLPTLAWTVKTKTSSFVKRAHLTCFYSVLARSGFFPVSELATFRKLNSRLQGHPTTHEGLPGVRIASGSLGQGMSVAIGAAETKNSTMTNISSIAYMAMVNFKKGKTGKPSCMQLAIE